MPVDLSFAEVAGFGAIVAVLFVLALLVLVGWAVTRWVSRHAARFKKLGIERTDQGHVQFSGFLHGQERREVVQAPLMDRLFGPSKFPAREDEEQPVLPEDIPSA